VPVAFDGELHSTLTLLRGFVNAEGMKRTRHQFTPAMPVQKIGTILSEIKARCCQENMSGKLDARTEELRKFATALFGTFIAWFVPLAQAQDSSRPGNAAAGRALALRVCTGCHVVASDQPFAPVFTGPPAPPNFSNIANMSNRTAASLRRFLSTLHAVPPPQQMADPYLTHDEREDIIAFIMTLRVHR
jgi:mono/diheme cytochrome c family protein